MTPPLALAGDRLELNVGTSALGEARVGLLDAAGEPRPGYTELPQRRRGAEWCHGGLVGWWVGGLVLRGCGGEVHRCDPLRGNFIAKTVTYQGQSDLTPLTGRPVRLHFVLRSAKLYAFQLAYTG